MNKKDSKSNKNGGRIITVTDEMRNAMKAKGIDDDEMLSVGEHTLRRRPKNKILKSRRDAKIKTSIFIEADIIDNVRERAEKSGTSFETQINKELRQNFERDSNPISYAELLQNEQFIGTLCNILEARLKRGKRAA